MGMSKFSVKLKRCSVVKQNIAQVPAYVRNTYVPKLENLLSLRQISQQISLQKKVLHIRYPPTMMLRDVCQIVLIENRIVVSQLDQGSRNRYNPVDKPKGNYNVCKINKGL